MEKSKDDLPDVNQKILWFCGCFCVVSLTHPLFIICRELGDPPGSEEWLRLELQVEGLEEVTLRALGLRAIIGSLQRKRRWRDRTEHSFWGGAEGEDSAKD